MEADTDKVKLRQENARKAKEAADKFFPNEQWKFVEEGIYLSSRRPIGKRSNYQFGNIKPDKETNYVNSLWIKE